jgi:hypothetical protein
MLGRLAREPPRDRFIYEPKWQSLPTGFPIIPGG